MLIVDHCSLLSTFGSVSALPYILRLVLSSLQMMPEEKQIVVKMSSSVRADIGSHLSEKCCVSMPLKGQVRPKSTMHFPSSCSVFYSSRLVRDAVF